jgi:hypothetical protein
MLQYSSGSPPFACSVTTLSRVSARMRSNRDWQKILDVPRREPIRNRMML